MKKFLHLAVLALGISSCSASPMPLHRDILVFVPAYEGSQLFDPNLESNDPAEATGVWGNLNVFFSTERYFSLRMPNPLQARKMLSVGPVDVYGAFVKALTRRQDDLPGFTPYTEGADFFIFNYDWRQEIATVSAPQLARAMESYAQIHAEKTGLPASQTRFIIVSHSMGGLVARTWLSENPAWAPRVARLYLVGAPNRGSIKAVRTVVYGPDSVKSHAHGFPGVLLNLLPTGVDQNVTKLVGITRPTLYELLPYDDPHWTHLGEDGSRRTIGANSLLESDTWKPFWPSAGLEKRLFIDDWLKVRQTEGRKKIDPAAWEFCQDAAYGHLQRLLRQTADWRTRQGTLAHTAELLNEGGDSTRLQLIISTGLETPSGLITQGSHDSTQGTYTYDKDRDGDGTVEQSSALDGFAADAPNVKVLQKVPHGRLMIDRDFLSYFLRELSDQPVVPR